MKKEKKCFSAEMAGQNSNLSQQLVVKTEEVNQLTAAQVNNFFSRLFLLSEILSFRILCKN